VKLSKVNVDLYSASS